MTIEINHLLVRTADLESMSQFFARVVGLEKGFRPPFKFSGAWLYGDDKPLIHLVEITPGDKNLSDYLGAKTSAPVFDKGTIDHIAFSGVDYHKLIERLEMQRIEYSERVIPSINEHQVFVDGPDNLKLEFLFCTNKSSI